jgi:hypothetical protein
VADRRIAKFERDSPLQVIENRWRPFNRTNIGKTLPDLIERAPDPNPVCGSKPSYRRTDQIDAHSIGRLRINDSIIHCVNEERL